MTVHPQSASVATAKPPRSGKRVQLRWVFIALIVVAGVVNYLDRNTLSIANTTIARIWASTPSKMGLLLSAFSWPYAIANLPAGYLVDKFGAKKMFAWAAAMWSVVTMLTAAAQLLRPVLRGPGRPRHRRIAVLHLRTEGLRALVRQG